MYLNKDGTQLLYLQGLLKPSQDLVLIAFDVDLDAIGCHVEMGGTVCIPPQHFDLPGNRIGPGGKQSVCRISPIGGDMEISLAIEVGEREVFQFDITASTLRLLKFLESPWCGFEGDNVP